MSKRGSIDWNLVAVLALCAMPMIALAVVGVAEAIGKAIGGCQ